MTTKKKMTKQELEERYSDVLNDYFYRRDFNKPNKLERLVDKILVKLRFVNVDNEDFYSLANEIFLDVLQRYDDSQDFNGFLYSCLVNKFKTEMTRRNRQKRQADRMAISWETPIDKESEQTIGDFITDTKKAEHYDIDKTFFEDDGEKYSERMLKYIKRLSKLHQEFVKLVVSGYSASEIKEILHISQKDYSDCLASISSYKNISIFFYN